MRYYKIDSPYFALLKAETPEEALATYTEFVAEDDGTLHELMKEVDRDYALASFSRALTEDGEQVPIIEILQEFQSEGSAILIIDSGLL